MKTINVRRPGQPGTIRLTRQFGDRLVCVRYRHDPEGRRRLKTVEIIIEEQPWIQGARYVPPVVPRHRRIGRVLLRVEYTERDLQRRVKEAGGTWMPGDRAWRTDYETAVRLGLEDRIVRFEDVTDSRKWK